MSTPDRLQRLGLSHLADKPAELKEALRQRVAQNEVSNELHKAKLRSEGKTIPEMDPAVKQRYLSGLKAPNLAPQFANNLNRNVRNKP